MVKFEHECQCITKARSITFKGADFDIMIKILNMALKHIEKACPKYMTLNYIGLYTIQITKSLHNGEISIWYNSICSTVNRITIISQYLPTRANCFGFFIFFYFKDNLQKQIRAKPSLKQNVYSDENCASPQIFWVNWCFAASLRHIHSGLLKVFI